MVMSIEESDLIKASVTASGLNQPILRFASLAVIHREPEYGGGIVLSVEFEGKRVQFVLDDEARLALLEQLSRPGHPVTAPGNFRL